MKAKWYHIDEKLPKEGEEVTIYSVGGILRQAVRDRQFGGWKEPNCGGWQQITSFGITHWTRAKVERPADGSWSCGPKDAPWNPANQPTNHGD